MSRLSKEARIAIYKEGLELLKGEYIDTGLCFILGPTLLAAYKKEGVDVIRKTFRFNGEPVVFLDEVAADFPELVAESTLDIDAGYWWSTDEERKIALRNAIKTLKSC
jgi:hypothetical protein